MTRYLDNHSDNLGDDEFETHSFSDEYSPTDGFTNRDHPREFYVQSPTSSSKDEEAAAESPAAASSSQHVVYDYRWSTLPPPRVPDERTPLMYEAPPAYSPPSSLYEQPSPRPENNLNPSSNALFPERAPESMGNPSDDAIEEFDMERQHRALEKTRISRLWSGTGRIVIIFVGILLLLLLLSKAFVGTSKSEKIPLPDTEPEPEPDKPPEKGTEPDKDIQPGKDTKPTLPPMPKLPEWCDMSISKSADFDFENPSSFLFSEEINTQEYTGGIFGGVRLVEAPSSQEHPVHVTVSISSSEPYVVSELHLQKMSDSLILQTPSFRHGEGGRHGYNGPCMAVDTTIYLQKDSKLEELEVKTKQLGISLGSGLDLGLRRTILATGSGKVASEAKLFYSRETRISVGAGSVYGHYNLRDLLSISTQSGSISVDVTPQDAAKDDEKPATLDISSKSGSIGVQMPPRDSATSLPKRDYRTIINTYVGSISGSYIHGSKTELESKSGSINADILPYSADDYTSTLSTFTSTGMSTIRLQSPYKGTTIKRMTSSHTAQTGSLNLLYPQEWEGNITGGTKTGSLTLRGKDVVIEEFDDGWANKRVTARKGKGHLSGKMDFRTTTGSVDVTIGDTLESRLKKECESAVHDIFGRPELPLQEEH